MADDDVFSSPDPLNNSLDSSLSRPVTRSQQSQRFVSLGRSSSPRKQTFELEVGDQKSPQKLFVTVESEQSAPRISRRLFTSPSPTPLIRRRERITTTTVALKGIDEDEMGESDTLQSTPALGATPKKRGRPRKNESTPKKATPVKKRSKTPARKTPRPKATTIAETPSEFDSHKPTTNITTRGRRTKKAIEEPASEASTATASKPARAKRTTKRKSVEDDTASVNQNSPPKRARRRLESLVPDEGANLVSADDEDLSSRSKVNSDEGPAKRPRKAAPESEGGDIWLDTLSDQTTPRPTKSRKSRTLSSIIRGETSTAEEEDAEGQGHGYGDLRDGPSDGDSQASRETTQQPESDIGDMHGALGTGAGDTDSVSEAESPKDGSGMDRDTIMQSEDFSMILMDSLPSVHDISAALAPVAEGDEEEELGDETNLVINRTLESIRQGMDSDKTEADEAEPEHQSQVDHSIVDIETEVVEGSPEAPQVTQLSPSRSNAPLRSGSPRRIKALPLSRQLLTFKAEQARSGASPQPLKFSPDRRSSRRSSTGPNEENSNLYEDSFSEIPEAVLEAATPRRPQATYMPGANGYPTGDTDTVDEVEAEPTPKATAEASSIMDGNTRSVRSESRLPTPDDTPSPINDGNDGTSQAKAETHVHIEAVEDQDPPILLTEQAESPQPSNEAEDVATESQGYNRQSTPPAATSSPRLPAIQDTNTLYPGNPQGTERRPTLSPIVRAGRALQSVTSDHSSPMGQKNTLGSPFRASSSGPSRPSTNPKFGASSQVAGSAAASTPQVQQVPARSDNQAPASQIHTGQSSFLKALGDSWRNLTGQQSPSKASVTSSTQATPPDDADEMSWMPTKTIHIAQAKVDSRNSSLVGTLGSLAHKTSAFELDDADDEIVDDEIDLGNDLFLAEAQRPTPTQPRQPRQQSFGKQAVPASRRTQLPNTWRRTSRLVSKHQEDSVTDEYSLVSQQSRIPSIPQREVQVKKRGAGGLDLSSFFSSPAQLPPAVPAGPPAKNAPAPVAKVGSSPKAPVSVSTSTMFSVVPQKEFHPTPVRRRRTDLFSSVPKAAEPEGTENTEAIPTEEAHAPATPEKVNLLPVHQKQNFTPRPRQTGGTTPLFGKSSATQSVVNTPPRMQLTRDEIEKWQEETSVLMEGSDSAEEDRRAFKPPSHRILSPTKSCLRSPLKPRTPGRVVEFTSSTLSPLQQMQERAQKAISNNPVLQPRVPLQPSMPVQKKPAAVAKVALAVEEDKENTPQHQRKHATDGGAQAQKEDREGSLRLSRTQWSKDHWVFLDQLLQLRRQGPFRFDVPVSKSVGLLGKMVEARGAGMKLERYHLDVIDAFKVEVGGWDEAILAKRLFALVLGEEDRKMAEEQTRKTTQQWMKSGITPVPFH